MKFETSENRTLKEAQGWLELGAFDEALKGFSQLVTNKESFVVLAYRCHCHLNLEQYKETREVACKLQQKFPTEVEGYVYDAISLNRMGRPQEGLDLLLKVKDQFLTNPKWCLTLGGIMQVLGMREEAIDAVHTALAYEPSLDRTLDGVKELKPIVDDVRKTRLQGALN